MTNQTDEGSETNVNGEYANESEDREAESRSTDKGKLYQ